MKNRRNNFGRLFLGLFACASVAACVHTEPMKKLVSRASTSPLPQGVNPQMQQSLLDFGAMVRGYTNLVGPIAIEVDDIPNNTGLTKELPKELGGYFVYAFQRMGVPFVVTRPHGGGILLDVPMAGLYNKEAPERPPAKLRLRGEMMRSSDRVVQGREGRASASGKIHGGDLNADAGVEGTATLRNFRVSCYLEDEHGRSLPGQLAIFEVWLRNDESAANFSVYFEGSGGGYNSKVQINQDVGDAALDAAAAATICLVGKWLQLPYWRVHPLFSEDRELVADLRTTLVSMPGSELDTLAKHYLFGGGMDFDLSHDGLSAAERELLHREMRKAHARPEVHEDKENYLFGLWRNLDYRAAAKRTGREVALLNRVAREKALAQQHAADPLPQPDAAPADAPKGVVHLNLSRLTPAERGAFVEVLKTVPTFAGLRAPEDLSACDLSYGGDPAVLQAALRVAPTLSGLDYYWQDAAWHSLEVVRL